LGAFFRHLADFFLNSCSAGKGAFLPRFGVVLFHSATGGTGGFFLADSPPFDFLGRFSFRAFSVGLFGLVGSLGSASDFWGFLLLIA
jgi:hypothetical protein